MKPKVNIAMRDLIAQIKQTLPCDGFDNFVCSDSCSGCSVKLIDFLVNELEIWEAKLNNKKSPNFKDINKPKRQQRFTKC